MLNTTQFGPTLMALPKLALNHPRTAMRPVLVVDVRVQARSGPSLPRQGTLELPTSPIHPARVLLRAGLLPEKVSIERKGESMRHLFYCDTRDGWVLRACSCFRLVMGSAFMSNGWPKIQNRRVGWTGNVCAMWFPPFSPGNGVKLLFVRGGESADNAGPFPLL